MLEVEKLAVSAAAGASAGAGDKGKAAPAKGKDAPATVETKIDIKDQLLSKEATFVFIEKMIDTYFLENDAMLVWAEIPKHLDKDGKPTEMVERLALETHWL